jgi:hypothetical protein
MLAQMIIDSELLEQLVESLGGMGNIILQLPPAKDLHDPRIGAYPGHLTQEGKVFIGVNTQHKLCKKYGDKIIKETIVHELIHAYIDMYEIMDSNAALFEAISLNDFEIVSLLLRDNPNPKNNTNNGWGQINAYFEKMYGDGKPSSYFDVWRGMYFDIDPVSQSLIRRIMVEISVSYWIQYKKDVKEGRIGDFCSTSTNTA